MKKVIAFLMVAVFIFAPLAYAGSDSKPIGPAPNSGDGVDDGSGLEDLMPFGPQSPLDLILPPGPAPNSGDGVSDGSGF